MTLRFAGLVPAIMVLAASVAHAQAPITTGGGGSMAYPDSLPSGQVKIPAPTARDTGNMAYPASPGGVVEAAPKGADTGNMAYPSNRAALTGSKSVAKTRTAAATPAATPGSMPTPDGMKAAQSLNEAPGSAPVPYVDFATPKSSGGKMMHKAAMHHMMKKAPAKAAEPAK